MTGSDAFSYAWLQYLYPFYLWFLIGAIILACRLSVRVSALFGRNPIAVLATVILMSYTKLLHTSIVALSFTKLQYPGNVTRKVWLYDANIMYFQGKHIILGLVAILVIAFLILPYIFLLTFRYHLLACSNKRGCLWLNRLKPLLDSYYAPFNAKARYWTGFLLLARGGLFTNFALSTNSLTNLTAILSVFAVLLVVLSLSEQRIYEKLYVNVLEVSFILNIGVVSIATYHVRFLGGNQTIVAYLSIGIAYVELVGILTFHLYLRIKNKFAKRRMVMTDHEKVEQLPTTVSDMPGVHRRLPRMSQLREPLLDD